MRNKSTLFIAIILSILVFSTFSFSKNTSVKNKILKNLNYDITYKEAFPDYNIRRSIILCIMRNKCGEDDYNSKQYEFQKYNNFLSQICIECEVDLNNYYQTALYVTDKNLGIELSEEEIERKEYEKIKKEELDKIQILIANNYYQEVSSLEGIKYLSNLKAIVLNNLTQENLDFSSNLKLEKIFLNTHLNFTRYFDGNYYIKNINIKENLKLKEIAVRLSKEDSNLDYSNLLDLEYLNIVDSKISKLKLPKNIKNVNVKNNYISELNLLTNSKLEYLNLENNPIEKINLTKAVNLKDINLYDTKLNGSIDFSKNINLEKFMIGYSLEYNKIHIEKMDFSNNPKLKILVIGTGLKEINLEKNVNLSLLTLYNNSISKLDLSKNVKLFSENPQLSIDNNEIKDLKLPKNIIGSTIQNFNLKIEANKYIDLPLYLNGKKLYLEDSINFIRMGDKYIFHNIGEYYERAFGLTESGFYYGAYLNLNVVAKKEKTIVKTPRKISKINTKDNNNIIINPRTGVEDYISKITFIILIVSIVLLIEIKRYAR